jgi:pSer/pThr/pTyr-binding forkhead associated (FHA) protein
MIPPGGSFCMEGGHPIALEGMQIGDAFGATAFAPAGAPMPPTGAMQGFPPEPEPPRPPPRGPGGPPPPPPQMQAPPVQAPPQLSPEGRRPLIGFLVSFQDDPLGKFWPLYQGKNTVGRAETGQKVDIEIAHGTTSTRHATIECDGPRIVLTDLGSTNGTFHNEEAIGFQGRRDLRNGDKVRFGGFSVITIVVAAFT